MIKPPSDGSTENAPHTPVLLREVVDALEVSKGGVFVDATFGAGGYTSALIKGGASRVIGLDRDPTAISAAKDNGALSTFIGEKLILIETPFADVFNACHAAGVDQIDGIVFDLGVSSMQLDQAGRGFSFRQAGPLSMRMDNAKPDAADFVNTADEDDMAIVFKVLGEERHARRIAREIVSVRQEKVIDTTIELAEIVERAQPAPRGPQRIHPATRVFQAIRMFVNDELGQLARALRASELLLREGGRLVVVTFHSLEDRVVKQFFVDRANLGGSGSRHLPQAQDAEPPVFDLRHRKAVIPSEEEIARNPRSRSAKLRTGIRTAASAPETFDPTDFLPRLNLSPAMQNWSYTR
ncbi:MAG: 16S rRNA (cytosine(1402)-N(4))-methyltransferase RsmH [Pseudomonadota bacterium]